MTPWTVACQASLSTTNSGSLLKLMCIELVMPSNHLILCHPLLLQLSLFPYTTLFRSATSWTVACQASLSTTNSCSLLKLMSIESVMPSNHFLLCHPLLLLPSIFPNIRLFSNKPALRIRWPKYWKQLQHQSFQ